MATARFLGERLSAPVDAWLKIDAGYGRTGLAWDDFAGQAAVAGALAATTNAHPRGLLSHSGQTYHADGTDAIRAVWTQTLERLDAARDALAAAGFPGLELAPGDTPGCAVVDDLSGVDEVRPGNFVFFDAMQVEIGSCGWPDVAVAVACPVVALHPERSQIVVYGGAVHLSKEYLTRPDGRASYGAVALPLEGGWGVPVPGAFVSGLSQEHGIVSAPPELLAQIQRGRPADGAARPLLPDGQPAGPLPHHPGRDHPHGAFLALRQRAYNAGSASRPRRIVCTVC